MYLYHLTKKENMKSILDNGLIPKIGEHSKIVGEDTPAIYMSERKHIPYWRMIFPDLDALVKIEFEGNLDDYDVYTQQFSGYGQVIVTDKIENSRLEEVKLNKVKPDTLDKVNKCFCESLLNEISRFCVHACRYYTYLEPDETDPEQIETNKERHDSLRYNLDYFKSFLPKLDYSKISKQDIREELKFQGENGAYTLVDKYDVYYQPGVKNKRLYQQLTLFSKDDLTDDLIWLNNWIRTNLKGCLKVNTGGWTG